MRLLNRGLAYEAHIADARRHREAEQLEGFGNALVALYARVARFLASAYRVQKLNTFHKSAHAFWKPEDIIGFQGDCKELEAAVSKEAELCNAFATRTLYDTLLEINTSTTDMTCQISETNDHVKDILQQCSREKRTRCLPGLLALPSKIIMSCQGRTGRQRRRSGSWTRKSSSPGIMQMNHFYSGSMEIVSFVISPDMVPDEANKALQMVPAKRSSSPGSWTTSRRPSTVMKVVHVQMPPNHRKTRHSKLALLSFTACGLSMNAASLRTSWPAS